MKIETREICNFESVISCRDKKSGLHAIVAIHDRTLGPAVGGCRMWPYPDESEALLDVLNLARGMTYKSALANLPFGGGKAVIIGNPETDKSPELLRSFGRFVDKLGGRFVAAEDVGILLEDVQEMARETRHVSGAQTDPSPFTARGVLSGIRAAVRQRFSRGELSGSRIAVQGLGMVGLSLTRQLLDLGADVIAADRDPRRCTIAAQLGARIVDPDEILLSECEVLAPCALGGVISAELVPRLRTQVIAGAANNQLASLRAGDLLHEFRILYAPDYVINAGGIIQIAAERRGSNDPYWAHMQIDQIADRLAGIFGHAARLDEPTHRIADRLALDQIEAARVAA